MYYALFNGDDYIATIYAQDKAEAIKQLKGLGAVFKGLNNQFVKYQFFVDTTGEDIVLNIIVLKGLAEKVILTLVKQ